MRIAKGFAVVAEQIRELADQSRESTEHINQIVNGLIEILISVWKQLRRYRKHLKSRMPRLKIQKLYLQLLIQRLTGWKCCKRHSGRSL